MTSAEALTAVKLRVDIPNATTTWDTELNDFVAKAVFRLYPKAQLEVAVQTSAISPDTYGEATVNLSTLSTPLVDIRRLEVYAGGAYTKHTDFKIHGVNCRITNLDTSVTSCKIYGLARYIITTCPEELQLAVIYYAMAEFYDYLTGNKRKFNIYSQLTGGRAVDDMRDQAIYYEQKGDNIVQEHAFVYGAF